MNPHSHEPSETRGTVHPSAFDIGLHRVALKAPLQWLRLGWLDFMRAPVIASGRVIALVTVDNYGANERG